MLSRLASLLVSSVVVDSSHPMAPTCHGFGGIGAGCAAALPGSGGKRRGSGFGSTSLAVKVAVPGCFLKPCWLQGIRVGVDESNAVDSPAKVGVYWSNGTLAAMSKLGTLLSNLPLVRDFPDKEFRMF